MSTKRFILSALLVGIVAGCDSGGGGSSDDPYTQEQVQIVEQSIYEPPVVDAPIGEPAATRSYSLSLLGLDSELVAETEESGLNDAGEVIGTTQSKAWFYSDGITRDIGLTQVESVPSSASHGNDTVALNESGQVIGTVSSIWVEDDPVLEELHILAHSDH